jgi:hypothetical protein
MEQQRRLSKEISLAAEEISFTNVFTPVCLDILIYIQQTVIPKVCPTV